jgi:3-methylcrotonyl-CoA carboxylase alpha subunit
VSGAGFRRKIASGERTLEAALMLGADGRLVGEVHEGTAKRALEAHAERASDGAVLLRVAGRLVRARVLRQGGATTVVIGGRTLVLEDAVERRASAAGAEPHALSPMTGRVVKVHAASGQALEAGSPLFVVEAMKMEYVVRAPRALTVREVKRAAGDKVALGEVVVTFEAAGGA